MTILFANTALLADGFANNVRITIDSRGYITTLETDAEPGASDSRADILIPGMPNVHSHAFQRMTAGLAEHTSSGSDTFWTWRSLMYEIANRLGPDDILAIASQLYMELLKSGYTSVAEFHYLHAMANPEAPLDVEMSEAILEASRQTGIGLTLLPVIYEVSGFGASDPTLAQRAFHHTPDAFVTLVETLIGKTAPLDNIDLGIGFHSLRAVRPETFASLGTWASHAMADRPVHIHIAEQEREVRDCLEFYGARPVEWLLGHLDVGPTWCLIHATHMTNAEATGAAACGAIAGLCPTTEANLGDGFFGLPAWLEKGGALGVGSDSNVCNSPVEELRLLEYGNRLRERRRLISTSPEHPGTGAFLWSVAAQGGARALGRKAGAIAEGNKADFLDLDSQHPTLCTARDQNLLNTLVFGPSEGAIQNVYVGGTCVIKQGHHPLEEAISAKYRATVRALSTA